MSWIISSAARPSAMVRWTHCIDCGRQLSNGGRKSQTGLCIHCWGRNTNWKGDDVLPQSHRARARRRFKLPPICQIRGCTNPATDRHHIDGDPGNNVRSNIAGLCHPCHMTVHNKSTSDVCKNGHPRTLSNTYIPPGGGGHQCRMCRADIQRKRNVLDFYKKAKAARKAS